MPPTNPARRRREDALSSGPAAVIGQPVGGARGLPQALGDDESAKALEGFATASWWPDGMPAATDGREQARGTTWGMTPVLSAT